MDKNIARHIAKVALKCCDELTELAAFVDRHSDAAESQEFAKGVSGAIECIHTEVINRMYGYHPELKHEIDESMKKYGIVLY
jgi:hypothetical protein